ncbi:MAG TPA: hypothetical protein VNV18_19290 [Stellaceae bacterium]|jgi:hypothetical protein|nr:hypothetical protein [Stellaceae bacterium]
MQHAGRAAGLAVAAIFALLVSGCAVAKVDPPGHPVAAAAPYAPPPERAEIPPPPLSADLLWLNGHWTWDGAAYAWTPGAYVQRPSPTANWLPGYWEQGSGGWSWTDGHWES